MIRLSNGHQFEYLAAAGALGYDGQGWPWEQPLRLPGWLHPQLSLFEPRLFTAVTKTLTPTPTAGNMRWPNPWRCLRFIPDGVVNAIGLTNPGFGWWCERVALRLDQSPVPLIVSITADDIEQLALMVGRLERCHVVGIEFNPACPNIGADLATGTDFILAACRTIKERTTLPLLLKLSVRHPAETIVAGTRHLVEAYSVNSVPWSDCFPDRPSPLAELSGGAVSGGAAQRLTWAYARRLRRLSYVPVIGPSVWWFEDLMRLRAMGMAALSFGSIWLRYPWRPTLYVRRDRALNKRKFILQQQVSPFSV